MPTGPYAEQILDGIDAVNATLSIPIRATRGARHSASAADQGCLICLANKQKWGDRHARGSEVGKCARRLGYRLLGARTEGEYRPGSSITFGIGNFVEALAICGIRAAGFPVEHAQAHVQVDEPYIPGHIDGEVWLPNEDWSLLEAKSANQKWFDSLVRSGVRETYPDHYSQMQLYLRERKRPQAFYVCVSKNNADVYTELVPYDPAHVERDIERVRRATMLAEKGELPEPEYHKSSTACRQCPYNKLCDGKTLRGSMPFIVA